MPTNSLDAFVTSASKATAFLVAGMLVSGVCNTILNKFQDMQCVENCSDPDPNQRRYFEQPVWQTLNMFVGEAAVWIVHFYMVWDRRRSLAKQIPVPPSSVAQLDAATIVDDVDAEVAKHTDQLPLNGSRPLLFWIPTLCDLTATTIMNVGLLLTSASIYQMLRGSIVIFTGIASYLFLGRRFRLYEWISLVLVVGGVAIVGLSSVLTPQKRPADTSSFDADSSVDLSSLVGVLLVLGAQLFTATQFVVEEKIMLRYHVTPLKAVGFEGVFGLTSVLAAMPILHVLFGKYNAHFDISKGFHDFFDVPSVWQTGIAISISIAFFNWFGLSITSTISATARSIIDTCRTLFIWIVSLYLGWEQFSWIQVVGFTVMVIGTFYFNGVIRWPFAQDEENAAERAPLLESSRDEDESGR